MEVLLAKKSSCPHQDQEHVYEKSTLGAGRWVPEKQMKSGRLLEFHNISQWLNADKGGGVNIVNIICTCPLTNSEEEERERNSFWIHTPVRAGGCPE